MLRWAVVVILSLPLMGAEETGLGQSEALTDSQQAAYLLGRKLYLDGRKHPHVGDLLAHADLEALLAGVRDAAKGADLQVPVAQEPRLFQHLRQAVEQQRADASKTNLAAGKAHLAAVAKRDGVTVTESGIAYEVLKAAEGEQPSGSSRVKVHYTGTLIDGTVFDSSRQRGRPAEFGLTDVIKGWTEGIQLMTVGSRYRFHIPSNLAYGRQAPANIGPDQVLIFDVELLAIL